MSDSEEEIKEQSEEESESLLPDIREHIEKFMNVLIWK